jgi:esterase/lipase superfamily enzyme
MAPRDKSIRHQQYNAYVENEVVPYLRNAAGDAAAPLTSGVSLGAFHAANLLFRRPDLFGGVLGLSGIYDLKKYTAGYWDEDVYFNSPMDYLPNLDDASILSQLRSVNDIHFLSGSGAYEDPSATQAISDVLRSKSIPHQTEIWS